MHRNGSSSLKSSHFQAFHSPNHHFQPTSKQPQQDKSKSRSLLYRNRSLKQFFGDLPALNSYFQPRRQKENQKKSKAIVEDEYLIRPKHRHSKHIKEDSNFDRNQDCRQKAKDIAHEDPFRTKMAHTERVNTGPNLYDPKAYDWRKSPSKPNQQPHRKAAEKLRGSHMAQSEYYATPDSSQNGHNTGPEKKIKQIGKRPQIRSSSTDSHKKQRLQPKVTKHIFDLGSPKKEKKNLLFTFGL